MLGGKANTRPERAKTAKAAIRLSLAVFALFGLGFVFANSAFAQDQLGLGYAAGTGLTSTDIRVTIANIIRVALGILGIVAVLIVLYAGFVWMTAGGEEDKVATAKKILTSGIIGLLIIMTAFAIVTFVMNRLLAATTGVGLDGRDDTDTRGACAGLSATCPTGALGSAIESHYPPRNATAIPRNTMIVVTFKKKIDPASVTVGANGTVAIIKSSQVSSSSPQFQDKYALSLSSDGFDVTTADQKTFVFTQKDCSKTNPDGCIGSPSEDLFYTVVLRGGSQGIKQDDASKTAVFTGAFSAGYPWEFQVSTILDVTPPKVAFVAPADGSNDNPRNTLVQINFSEAVSPLGVRDGIKIAKGNARVAGENRLGNGYRSVEFVSDEPCGVNSCGQTIYCLPADSSITATVIGDSLTEDPPTGIFPPNGITDMAGNSLDGDGDGKVEGPSAEDFVFDFTTSGVIDTDPPTIFSQTPVPTPPLPPPAEKIKSDEGISATFNKLMSVTSLNSDNVRLTALSGDEPNFAVTADNLSSAQGLDPDRTRANILHDQFGENQIYGAEFTSGVQDLRQNCFYPKPGKPTCSDGQPKPFCCNGVSFDDEGLYRTACGLP